MRNLAVTARLRAGLELLRRPSGTLPPLSWRSRIFDALLALALGLAALAAGDGTGDVAADGDHEVRFEQIDRGPGDPLELPPPADPTAEPFLPIEQDQSGWAVVMVLVVLPMVARRRFPLAMLWLVLASAPAVNDYHAALRLSFYVCVVVAYSAAVYSPYRVPALASLPLAAVLYSVLQESAVPTVSASTVPFLILIPIAIAADGLRRWKRRADEGRARLSALEREQVEALQRATEHERARIARELHDVVTHNVSVMVIQAGAARTVMDTTPDAAREAMLAVEAGGRAAMAELRHVMGLLTMDGDGPDPAGTADLAPQPGLDRLPALVQRVRATGVPVELVTSGTSSTSGTPRPVPPGVQLAAYRVVQEALTNTMKHAVGASATVRVEHGADALRVRVDDTGGAPQAPLRVDATQARMDDGDPRAPAGGSAPRPPGGGSAPRPPAGDDPRAVGGGSASRTPAGEDPRAVGGGGSGLVGLRERLALYGGTLQAGPRPSGGYRVDARIPLDVPIPPDVPGKPDALGNLNAPGNPDAPENPNAPTEREA